MEWSVLATPMYLRTARHEEDLTKKGTLAKCWPASDLDIETYMKAEACRHMEIALADPIMPTYSQPGLRHSLYSLSEPHIGNMSHMLHRKLRLCNGKRGFALEELPEIFHAVSESV